MANIIASIVVFLSFGFFCCGACYGQFCQYWREVYEKLGKPDVKSTKELKTLWKQQKRSRK